MNNLKIMWDLSCTEGLIHNLISINSNYSLNNLGKFEDNLDEFGLLALTLALFPPSLGGFSFKPLVYARFFF